MPFAIQMLRESGLWLRVTVMVDKAGNAIWEGRGHGE